LAIDGIETRDGVTGDHQFVRETFEFLVPVTPAQGIGIVIDFVGDPRSLIYELAECRHRQALDESGEPIRVGRRVVVVNPLDDDFPAVTFDRDERSTSSPWWHGGTNKTRRSLSGRSTRIVL
jgi:hypothetical protein